MPLMDYMLKVKELKQKPHILNFNTHLCVRTVNNYVNKDFQHQRSDQI